jgi:hypothetical protein
MSTSSQEIERVATALANPGSSSDLEDIVTLLNGRPTLVQEISEAPLECKKYLSQWFAAILKNQSIMDVIPYHLPPHSAGQARLPIVLDRIKGISALST